jgi:predicted GIY-YIG superfamily endonuclease
MTRVMPWYVYILDCTGGCYYVGHTENLDMRFAAHLAGTGAEFTRRHRPSRVAYTEEFLDESSAVRRELQLKHWSRAKKLALIAGQFDQIHHLARRRSR